MPDIDLAIAILESVEQRALEILPGDFVPPDEAVFVSCRELFAGRRGSPYAANKVREYERRWRVMVNDRALGPAAVCLAPCLPWPYAPYVSAGGREYDYAALMVYINAEQEHADDWQSWIVTARFSTEVDVSGPNYFTRLGMYVAGPGGQNHPELEMPEIEWGGEDSTEAPPHDRQRRPYLNSAGDPFSPAVAFPASNPILVVTHNRSTFGAELQTRFTNAVNSVPFAGHPAGTVQAMRPEGKLTFRGRIPYYRTTWRFRIKVKEFLNAQNVMERERWQPKILDAGTRKLMKLAGVPLRGYSVPIVRHGHAITSPWPLDGSGGELQADPVTGLVEGVYLEFEEFPEDDLNDIFTNLFVP